MKRFTIWLLFMALALAAPGSCQGEIDADLIRRNQENHVETKLTDWVHLAAGLEWPDTVPASLFEYSREVYEDLDDRIGPEDFPQYRVVEILDDEKDEYGSVVYYMENRTYLSLLYGDTLSYRTNNGDHYAQLWLLEKEAIEALPAQDLDFMTAEQAKDVALRFLQAHEISSPCIQEIYSLNQAQLAELTAHMRSVAPEVSSYFPEVRKEHEVYYITLGHSFDGLDTLGYTFYEETVLEPPYDLLCVSSEGIPCVEVSDAGGAYRKEAAVPVSSLEDVLAAFAEDQQQSLRESTIDRIALAYFSEEREGRWFYEPCWVIHSYYIPDAEFLTGRKTAFGKTCFIPMGTGELHYLSGSTEIIYLD